MQSSILGDTMLSPQLAHETETRFEVPILLQGSCGASVELHAMLLLLI